MYECPLAEYVKQVVNESNALILFRMGAFLIHEKEENPPYNNSNNIIYVN
jgi:hypothetical protein